MKAIAREFKELLIIRGYPRRKSGLKVHKKERNNKFLNKWKSQRFELYATLINYSAQFVVNNSMQNLEKEVGCVKMQREYM